MTATPRSVTPIAERNRARDSVISRVFLAPNSCGGNVARERGPLQSPQRKTTTRWKAKKTYPPDPLPCEGRGRILSPCRGDREGSIEIQALSRVVEEKGSRGTRNGKWKAGASKRESRPAVREPPTGNFRLAKPCSKGLRFVTQDVQESVEKAPMSHGLDSRFRGNDGKRGVFPSGHPRESGDPGEIGLFQRPARGIGQQEGRWFGDGGMGNLAPRNHIGSDK